MEDVDSSSSASNRSGRSGSLSRFMDKNGRNRRNSTTSSHSDCEGEAPGEFQSEVMTLIAMEDKRKAFQHLLNLEVEIIFDTLEETDSGLRTWLLQYDVVKEVLRVFSTPVLIHTPSNGVVLAPSIIAEPSIKEPLGTVVTTVSHEKAPLQAFVSAKVDEEYGYYKHVFVCSEIIMRVYTGEDDLYESFRMSSSSSGSAAVNEELTFGCQTQDELELWRLFFIYFTENDTIDEVQAAFYCKAFIRLHDAYCLEDGYVQVVLEAYVPALLKHLYMPTIKHLLLKLLQSYESIHPLTGVHDAMEAVAPLLIQAATLPVDLASPAVGNLLAARENACRLLVEMLQANQADRLGSFLRREDNQFLAKYFVVRIEAVTEGYHNFLQFMLLEEFGKEPKLMDQLFAGSIEQLAQVPVWPSTIVAPCMLNIHVVSELLRIYCRYKRAAELNPKKAQSDGSDDLEDDEDGGHVAPPANGNPAVMYELSGLKEAETSLWPNMKKLARATTTAYVNHFFTQTNVPTSVDIAIAKHLYRLVTLQDPEVDSLLVQAGVLPKYLNLLQAKPDADMLLIHVVSALLFVITDKSQTRSGSCVLVRGIFGESIDLLQTIVDVYKKQHRSKAYFKVLNDTMLVMLVSECPSPSQAVVVERAIAHAAWHALNCETKRNLGLSDAVDAAASTAPTSRRNRGKHEVHAFHFNTQGHGIFWVLVDSKETKVTWLQELLSAITGIPFSPKSAHEVRAILFPTGGEGRLSSKQMRAIVLGLYALLFGDDLEFNDPSRSPPLLTGDALCQVRYPVLRSCHFGQHDRGVHGQYVHPNVVLSSNLPSTVPYWGEYHGFQGFLQFCKVREETVERLKGRVLRVVADEDESTVVVMTAVTLRIVHNSEVVLEESCDIVELTDGKISTIHLNFDSAQLSTSFQQ
ncbi:hypothetical protein DYB32_004095 [Aphanomyces invadans]|uniref:PH domain-containing protein n=1 Tax=Aphanomyces invadans TaxID=157072 RepID=A0A418AYI6_9STRA|nr:hypothetical protein DYB32_004095 [Aphanomyces invadans]